MNKNLYNLNLQSIFMFLIVLFRILFYVFFIAFFGAIAYICVENKKEGMWSGKKTLAFVFATLMSFFLAMYFAFSEPNRLIKYHLKISLIVRFVGL